MSVVSGSGKISNAQTKAHLVPYTLRLHDRHLAVDIVNYKPSALNRSDTQASPARGGHTAGAAHLSTLSRQLGLFDVTMVVMGGIVGAGIFINPYVVAQQLHTPSQIVGAWIFGGVIALAG